MIQNIKFERFMYSNKEYLVRRDVFNLVISDNQIIVLLKENDNYIEDNLVSLNTSGEVIWDNKKSIECSNRRGATFVGLGIYDE